VFLPPLPAGGGGLLVDLGLLIEPVGAGQPDLGGLVPPLSGLGQADLAFTVVGQGLGMGPPVLEGLGGPVQDGASLRAATQFLETTSLLIGPLMVVRGVAWDGSPDSAVRSWNCSQPRATAIRAGMRKASQTRRR
jgi:hypothetical protein